MFDIIGEPTNINPRIHIHHSKSLKIDTSVLNVQCILWAVVHFIIILISCYMICLNIWHFICYKVVLQKVLLAFGVLIYSWGVLYVFFFKLDIHSCILINPSSQNSATENLTLRNNTIKTIIFQTLSSTCS